MTTASRNGVAFTLVLSALVASQQLVLAGNLIPINTETTTCGGSSERQMLGFEFALQEASMQTSGSQVQGTIQQIEVFSDTCGTSHSTGNCNHFPTPPSTGNTIPGTTTAKVLSWTLDPTNVTKQWYVDKSGSEDNAVKHHYGYTLKPVPSAPGASDPESVVHTVGGTYRYKTTSAQTCSTHPTAALTVYKAQDYKGQIPTLLSSISTMFLSQQTAVSEDAPESEPKDTDPETCLVTLELNYPDGIPLSVIDNYRDTIDFELLSYPGEITLSRLTTSHLAISSTLMYTNTAMIRDVGGSPVLAKFCPPSAIVKAAMSKGELVVRQSWLSRDPIDAKTQNVVDTFIGIPIERQTVWTVSDIVILAALLAAIYFVLRGRLRLQQGR